MGTSCGVNQETNAGAYKRAQAQSGGGDAIVAETDGQDLDEDLNDASAEPEGEVEEEAPPEEAAVDPVALQLMLGEAIYLRGEVLDPQGNPMTGIVAQCSTCHMAANATTLDSRTPELIAQNRSSLPML